MRIDQDDDGHWFVIPDEFWPIWEHMRNHSLFDRDQMEQGGVVEISHPSQMVIDQAYPIE